MTAGNGKETETLLDFLRGELAPSPGRLGNATRIAVLTVLVVLIAETFRIPLIAYSAYIVFFASKEETASTTLTGVVLVVAAVVAVLFALGIYMVSAGEPGVRLPLMALTAFGGVFLSRISPLGPAAFAVGFVATVSLTLIDVVPSFAPLPATTILTQTVLWLWVVTVVPIGLVVLGNLLTGRGPDEVFRLALADRLEAAGLLMLGRDRTSVKAGRRLMTFLRAGMTEPLRHLEVASRHRRDPDRQKADLALVARTYDVMMLADEWRMSGTAAAGRGEMAQALGRYLLDVAKSLARGEMAAFPELAPVASSDGDPEALLLARLRGTVLLLPSLLGAGSKAGLAAGGMSAGGDGMRSLIVADAFGNPQHVKFALKVTLAVMLAYAAYNLLAWPEIRTAMITCFFVTFGTMGETAHRMTLRLAGAALGGLLGLASVVFLMPLLTSVGHLALLIGAVSFLAAWIATSSDRLAYAGMQLAMAFFLCVLVGNGPHVELGVARDRLIGILLGNGIVWLVFSTVWPVSILRQARVSMADALCKVADVVQGTIDDRTVLAIDDALAQVRRSLSFEPFEPARVRDGMVDARSADRIRALLRPAIVLGPDNGLAWTRTYRMELGDWLRQAALWTLEKAEGQVPPVLPAISDIADGPMAWCRRLDERARELHDLAEGWGRDQGGKRQ